MKINKQNDMLTKNRCFAKKNMFRGVVEPLKIKQVPNGNREAKSLENGDKMVPQSSPNGPQIDPGDSEIDPRGSKIDPGVIPEVPLGYPWVPLGSQTLPEGVIWEHV